ncbi:unnamed protein product [Trifolium pratense]|uniref:Uncharacterized protein n=1 Tax=Trifolium pratense TaxID=57577 RepID=A0ACB0JFV7_TRIPR|nr:unnamed protein product [Trifolium pratense]
MMAMPRVSNSSLQKDNDSFFLAFLYILLAGLFRSILFPFERISCLFAKLIDVEEEQEDNTEPNHRRNNHLMVFSKKAKKSRVNALPLVSSSSTRAPSKDHDSVPAKLKDVVGEEPSTDSVPKGIIRCEALNSNGAVKTGDDQSSTTISALELLKTSGADNVVGEEDNTDSIPNVASLTNRDIFKMWCTMNSVTYPSKKEEDRRFRIFQEALALARPPVPEGEQEDNTDSFCRQDVLEEEEEEEEEDNTDSVPDVASLSQQDLFKMWCTMCSITHPSKKEKNSGSVSSGKLLHAPPPPPPQQLPLVPILSLTQIEP